MLSLDLVTTGLDSFNINIDVELSDILDEAAEMMVKAVLVRFESEKDSTGKSWIPSRAGMQRKLQGGGGTLYDTGNLFRSIHYTRDSDTSRKLGYSMPYGATHQLGLAGLPKREFIGLSPQDVSMVQQVIENRLKVLIKD